MESNNFSNPHEASLENIQHARGSNFQLEIFSNAQLGDIRIARAKNGEPWFCLPDLCKLLNLSNPSKVAQRLDEEDKANLELGLPGSKPTFVTESGMYSVILRSDSPLAKPMQKWVTSEVLPSIRKHGVYATPATIDTMLSNPDAMIAALTQLKQERSEKERLQVQNDLQAKELKDSAPKVLFAKAVETSNRSCLIAELAKIITQNGIQTGQNRLFKWMRNNGYLCSHGAYYNQPTQRAMEKGLFEIKQTTISKPDGTTLVNTTPKVTGKGQVFFVSKFIKNQEERRVK